MHRNVQEISALEKEALASRTMAERMGDFVALQSGRMRFILLHAIFFGLWISWNSGWLPGIKPIDPFPFALLTMVVSLEAIFLSLFILMSQNRTNRQAEIRSHLDLQINLLAEDESTKTLELLQALCKHHGLACANDPDLEYLVRATKPTEVMTQLRESLPDPETTAPPES